MESVKLVSLTYDGRILYKGRVYNQASQNPQVLGLRCYVYDTEGKVIGLDFDMDTVGDLWVDMIQRNNLISAQVPLYLPKDTDTFLSEDEIEGKIKIFDCSLEYPLVYFLAETLTLQRSIGYKNNSLSYILMLVGYIQSKFRSKKSYVLSDFNFTPEIGSCTFRISTGELSLQCDCSYTPDYMAVNFKVLNFPAIGSRRAVLTLSTDKLGTFNCLKYLGDEILNMVGTMLVVLRTDSEGKTEVTYNNKTFRVRNDRIVTRIDKANFQETIVIER